MGDNEANIRKDVASQVKSVNLNALFILDGLCIAAFLITLIAFPDMGLLPSREYGYDIEVNPLVPVAAVFIMRLIRILNLAALAYLVGFGMDFPFRKSKNKSIFPVKWWVYLICICVMVIGSSLADSYFNQLETYRRVWMDLTPATIDSVVFIAAYAYGMSKLKRLRKTDAET